MEDSFLHLGSYSVKSCRIRFSLAATHTRDRARGNRISHTRDGYIVDTVVLLTWSLSLAVGKLNY